jgi:hypothetical protein
MLLLLLLVTRSDLPCLFLCALPRCEHVLCAAVKQMALQARQVLAACEKTPTDEVPVNYDPRNPFDICCVTFTPIYRCAGWQCVSFVGCSDRQHLRRTMDVRHSHACYIHSVADVQHV